MSSPLTTAKPIGISGKPPEGEPRTVATANNWRDQAAPPKADLPPSLCKQKRTCSDCATVIMDKNKSGLCRVCYLASIKSAGKTCSCGKLLGNSNKSGLCSECHTKKTNAAKIIVTPVQPKPQQSDIAAIESVLADAKAYREMQPVFNEILALSDRIRALVDVG